MPLAAAIVPAVIGAGAAVYSASQQTKAANKAQQAQDAAAQQQLQLQREQFDRVVGLNQPFINGGYAAFDQLLSKLGVTGAGQPQTQPAGGANKTPGGFAGTSPVEPMAPQTGGVDYARLFQDRPDVMAEYQRVAAQADRNSPEFQRLGLDRGAEGFADYWLGSKPAEDTYAAPQIAAQPQQPATPAQPAAPAPATDPNAPPNYMTMARPEAPAAPEFSRPDAMSAPQLNSFIDPSKFQVDPGYQFRLKEGLNAVNAASAARGKLRSGDAARALQERGEGLANQGYNEWYQRQLAAFDRNNSQFQYGQNRADNVFTDDRAYDTARWQDQRDYGDARFDAERGYQTNRYDTDVNNLFRLTGVGTGAAGAVSGAGGAYANNAGSIFGNQADAASVAANQRAAANAGAVGAVAGAASNVFANWGGGARSTTPTSVQSLGSAWGFQNAPTSQNFLNTPSSIRPVF